VITRQRWAVTVLVAIWCLGAGANLLFTTHAVNTSQHRWCATLALLTSQPPARAHAPGPGATAAQKDAYRTWIFYGDLIRLRDSYGCERTTP